MAEQVSSPIQVDAKKEGITFEQFLKLYDGKHAEWFDGRVEVYVSADEIHQNLFMFLVELFRVYLSLKRVGRLMVAPFSMYIPNREHAREPDLMLILNEHVDRIKPTYLDGAADICIEIVSPESVSRDYGDKFKEYEAAGVREYWLIDPERHVFDIQVLQPNGLYARKAVDEQGRVISSLLPGFALNPNLLWQEDLPSGLELLRLLSEMTGVKLSP
jgi:Uma2 family endonuclease